MPPQLQQKVMEFEALYNEEVQSYESGQQALEQEVQQSELASLHGHLEAGARMQRKAIEEEHR